MAVDEAARRTGAGKALIAEVVRLAEERGCDKVSLLSNLKREEAHRFYEAVGFVHTHKGFTHYFPD